MRLFEIILLALDAGLLLWLIIPLRPRGSLPIITILIALALGLHLIAEGFRWQMTVAFIFSLGLLSVAWVRRHSPSQGTKPAWRSAFPVFIGLVLLLLSTAVPFIMPVPIIPEPSGPYAIGTATYHLVDGNRKEIFGEDPGGARNLMLQVWYPAEPDSSAALAPYVDQLDVVASVLAARLDLPRFFLGHLNRVKTHALINAMPAGGNEPYPLILFSHGLSGLRMQNTAQFEELASHGYIIASVDHTYDSVITILPDGRAILHHGQTVMPAGVSAVLSGRRLLEVRVQDLAAALAFLEKRFADPETLLHKQIDLDRVGVMGHSTGGGTAIQFCAHFARCQAVLVLDGWVEPLAEETTTHSLNQPSMFMNTKDWLGNENRSLGELFIDRQDQDSYQVTIEEMGHYNFTDIPLLTPIAAQLGLSGPIDGARGIQIVNDYTLAFLDRHLMEIEIPGLEEIDDRYWEVSFASN